MTKTAYEQGTEAFENGEDNNPFKMGTEEQLEFEQEEPLDLEQEPEQSENNIIGKMENYTPQQKSVIYQKSGILSIPQAKKWDDAERAALKAEWGNSDSLPQEQKLDAIARLAKKFGRNNKQIISQLSRLQVYTAFAYKPKTGSYLTREDMAISLGLALKFNESEVYSASKLSKTALAKILAKITA